MRCKDIGRGDLRVLRSGQLSTSPCCRLAVRKGFAPRYPDCHPPGRSLDGDCVKRFLLRYASSVQHRRASSCFELLRASKTRRSSRNPSASRSLCAPSYGLVPFGARGPETSPRACCKKLRIVRSCRSSCIGGRRFGSCPQRCLGGSGNASLAGWHLELVSWYSRDSLVVAQRAAPQSSPSRTAWYKQLASEKLLL